MSKPRLMIPAVALFLVTSLAIDAAVAAAPATYHDTYRQDLALYREHWVGGYRQAGKHSDTWDKQVIAFLEASAIREAGDSVDSFYWPTDMPTQQQLAAQAEALVELGCDDPLVLALGCMWRGRSNVEIVQSRGPFDPRPPVKVSKLQGSAAVKVAADGLARSKYSDFAVAEVCRELYVRGVVGAKPEEHAEAMRTVRLRWLAACKPGASARIRQKLVSLWCHRTPDAPPQIHDAALIAIVREHEPRLDSWVLHMLLARHLTETAKFVPGVKRPVMSPNERSASDTRLREAAGHLKEARKLEPTLPEPATEMIAIASAIGDQGDSIDWFGHALAAQPDYVDAYDMLRLTLQPSVEGAQEQLLQLAEACLVQPRYDTLMPWQYLETIRGIGADQQRSWRLLAEPQIHDNVVKVVDGYIAGGPETRRAYYRSVKAAVALKVGKNARCRAALDQVTATGASVDTKAFDFLDIPDPHRAISFVYLRTGEHRNEVASILKACDEGKVADALAAIRRLHSTKQPKDPELPALEILREDIEFIAGEWVTLKDPKSFPTKERFGFTAIKGLSGMVWVYQEPTPFIRIEGKAGESEKLAIWNGAAINRDISADFEMELHLLFPHQNSRRKMFMKPAPNGEQVTLGVAFYHPATKHREYALVDYGKKRVGFAVEAEWDESWDADVGIESVLTVRCVDRRVTLQLDGKPIGEPHRLGIQLASGFQVGIGGIDASQAFVRKIRVRNLNAPVDAAAVAPPVDANPPPAK